MHPSKFFDEACCRTSIDVFEIGINGLKNLLSKINRNIKFAINVVNIVRKM